ncbi:hypothetical protein [Pseudopelagicola sp. nBUS_19]|uniref:hypothetical protein n=1 Tax=Pseudopelagicola sp. nBUS_19 TaxID=3395316 RepID=UPI003EB6ADEA
MMLRNTFLIWACVLTLPAAGQESFGATERLEIWRHVRLQETRENPANTLTDFSTDGCSGGMSATWALLAQVFPEFSETFGARPPWEVCCVRHDRAYHQGGANSNPNASFLARLEADKVLRDCIIGAAATRKKELHGKYGVSEDQISLIHGRIGQAMFNAVRLGGGPCSGLPWRWGFGWPQC